MFGILKPSKTSAHKTNTMRKNITISFRQGWLVFNDEITTIFEKRAFPKGEQHG